MSENSKTKIIFVCTGNVCRSTMSEFIFKNLVRRAGREDDFNIWSAGTIHETKGMDVHEGTREILEQYGIPYNNHEAHRITPEEYEEADYIVCMDEKNRAGITAICGEDRTGKISKLLEFAGEDCDISDPYFTGDFDATYDDVIRGCRAFAEKVLE